MIKPVISDSLLFELTDVFGKKVRTTKDYWNKIKTLKHSDLRFDYKDVQAILKNPDEVYRSVKDEYIRLFYKKFQQITVVVVVKYLNGNGFVVTVYQTSKTRRKGVKLWPK